MSRTSRWPRLYRISLHIGDELGLHMSPAAWCAYTRLRMTYLAEGGPLAACDRKLRLASGLDPGNWKRVRAEVLEHFIERDGMLVHAECEAMLTRKLRGNIRQDQIVMEFGRTCEGGTDTRYMHGRAEKPLESKAIELKKDPCARPLPLNKKNQNPSCCLGDSDSGSPPAETNQEALQASLASSSDSVAERSAKRQPVEAPGTDPSSGQARGPAEPAQAEPMPSGLTRGTNQTPDPAAAVPIVPLLRSKPFAPSLPPGRRRSGEMQQLGALLERQLAGLRGRLPDPPSRRRAGGSR